ncbi:MAG: universal stress protein [Chloroflexi bacterium]|nr:universal stress protein [Chloroflexota bacterium]
MFEKLLVALDGSPVAEQVLPYVEPLARDLKAPVTLLHVLEPLPEEVRAAYLRLSLPLEELINVTKAQEYLALHARRLREAGLAVEIQTITGHPAEAIVEHAQQRGFGLIAMTTHGRSGVRRWTLGSVAEHVVRASHTPVFLVRATEKLHRVTAMQRLVVPLDGSPLAEGILPAAQELATRLSLPVLLVRVVTFPVTIAAWPEGQSYIGELMDQMQREAESYVEALTQRLQKSGLQVASHVVQGEPAGEIARVARGKPGSLVAISTHARSGLQRWILGSVTDKLIRNYGGPLVVFHPPAERPAGP